MSSLRRARILGTGMYVPPRVVTNKELESMMDTSDEWIRQRSGVEERRFAEPGQGPSDLALEAAREALADAGLEPKDLDLILVATLSPDYYFPGVSVFLQDLLGLSTTPAMDIRCQCSGFLYALNTAQLFIASGQFDRVLVVGAEVHSAAIDLSTRGRDVAVLFGDGAGAVVVGPSDNPEQGLMGFALHAEGKYRDHLKIEFPSTRQQPYVVQENIDTAAIYPVMEGRHVFKNAVTRMPEAVTEVLNQVHLKPKDVDLYLFHQANIRINEMVMKQLHQPHDKAFNNIHRYGNCSAASIPLLIAEAQRGGHLKEGHIVCMAAFGAGYTWASGLMRW